MRDRFVSAFPFRLRVTDLEHSISDESFLRVNPQRKLVRANHVRPETKLISDCAQPDGRFGGELNRSGLWD